MLGACQSCGHDPGFDFQSCPECGWRPGGPVAAAPARGPLGAPTVAESSSQSSNQGRWDETQHEGLRGREKPNLGGARGADFYQPLPGGGGGGRVRWSEPGADATVLDHGRRSSGEEDDSDHTILDHGRGPAEPESDSDATVISRGGGRRGIEGPLVYLVQRNGIRAGKVWLVGAETVIGRKPLDEDGQPIVIADDTVSKRHAKIRIEDGRFVFWDLASANGSFLVGATGTRERIYAPRPLVDGDTIELGDARVTYIEVEHEPEA
jgi:hypothetical protein